MNIYALSGQNFGKVFIRDDKLIKPELANSTESFKKAYNDSLKVVQSSEICDVVLNCDGTVFIYNNKAGFSTKVKGFSTPLKNFFMALRTANMMESLSQENI